MRHYKSIFVVLFFFAISACASEQTRPDPVKEELITLQKQLLELQKLQNETKTKLDESTATISTFSAKLQALEERQPLRTVSQSRVFSNPTSMSQNKKASPAKKKSKKKPKKIRRQE